MTRSDNVAELLHQVLQLHMAIHHLNEAMGMVETAELVLNSLAFLDTTQIMQLDTLQPELAQWVHIMNRLQFQLTTGLLQLVQEQPVLSLGIN